MGLVFFSVLVKLWIIVISIGLICVIMFLIKLLFDLFDILLLWVLCCNLGDCLLVSKIYFVMLVFIVFLLMWLFSNNIKISVILFFFIVFLIVVLFGLLKVIFGGGWKFGLSFGNSWFLVIVFI